MGSTYRPTYKNKDGTKRQSKIWWIKFFQDGRAVRESSGSEFVTVARRLLKTREGDVVDGRPITPGSHRITLRALCEDVLIDYRTNELKTLSTAERRLKKHIYPFFENCKASAVTTALAKRYTAKRLDEGAANATVNRELAILERAFSLARKADPPRVPYQPHIPKLKENNVRTGFFERDQFEAVVAHLPERLKPVVRFAYITGWRRSEILNLEWRQLDFAGRGSVRLETGTTKNGRGREIPMVRVLREVLEAQRASADEVQRRTGRIIPWVFFYTAGKRVGNRVGDFRKTWGVACMKAGLPVTVVYKRDKQGGIAVHKRGSKKGQPRIEKVKADSVLHDFRRTAVRNLERSGIPRKVAMQLTGHLTESVYQRYDIVSESDLLIAAEKLDGHGLGTVQPTFNDLPTSLSATTSS